MKKLALFIFSMACVMWLKADVLTDQIQAAFVGNAKTAIEFNTHGQIQYEFLDNVIEIGHIKTDHIAAIDLGAGAIQRTDNTVKAVDWSIGGKLHLAPILKNYITLNPEWQFLNTLEIDGRWSYDFTLRHGVMGISCAYPFK